MTDDLAPVAGVESLRFVGEPLALGGGTFRSRPRLARVGDRDVVLVYSEQSGDREVLVSRLIRDAFGGLPPLIGEPLQHEISRMSGPRGPFLISSAEFAGWNDGTFASWVPGGAVLATAHAPGCLLAFNQLVFPQVAEDGGLFMIDYQPELLAHFVSRRSSRVPEDGDIREWGSFSLPSGTGVLASCTGAGNLLVVGIGSPRAVTMPVFLASAGAVCNVGEIEMPALQKRRFIPRTGGGAWLAASTSGTAFVRQLDDLGATVGSPWHYRNSSPADRMLAFSGWRDGFALASSRPGGYSVLVSDGARTTYVEGMVSSDAPATQEAALLASDDGAGLLFVYAETNGLRLARLACGPGDPQRAFIPAQSAASEPMAPAAKPREAVSRPRLDFFLSLVRLRYIVSCISGLHYGMPPWSVDYRSREGRGRFFCSDGEANHHAVGWNEHGLVAIEFNHDDPDSDFNLERSRRNPGRFLQNVPAGLADLAEEMCDASERLATGGLWIDEGTSSACIPLGLHDGEEFLVDYTGTDDVAFSKWQRVHSLSRQHIELAVRLRDAASSGRYRLSVADLEALLAPSRGNRPLPQPKNVELARHCLAQIGIEWP